MSFEIASMEEGENCFLRNPTYIFSHLIVRLGFTSNPVPVTSEMGWEDGFKLIPGADRLWRGRGCNAGFSRRL